MAANLENSAVATGLEKFSFHSNPKERQCQGIFKLLHICTHLSSVQLLSRVWLFVTLWITACQASLSITISRNSLTLMSTSQWCHPAISSSVIPFSCPQSFPASGSFRLSQLALRIRCPKYWSFSFNISLSSEHPGLNSFRMDWLDLHRVAKSQIWLIQLSTHTHSQLKPLFLIRNSLLYICAGDIFTPKFRTLQ